MNIIIKRVGKGTVLEKTKIHRTKCSLLIKNVISRVLLEELVTDVDNAKYSLIVDESTDNTVNKYLCLCIKYFSRRRSKILTDFLSIIEVETVTAVPLHTLLTI